MNRIERKILFAFESNQISGFGHAIRCLSYAKELRRRNFLTFYYETTSVEWLKKEFYESSLCDSDSQNHEFDIIVIDSYRREFVESIFAKFSAKKFLQIADSYTQIFGVDGLVWLDICPPPQDYPVMASGLGYMPVRFHEDLILSPGYNHNVLVTVGGSPSPKLINEVHVAVSKAKFEDYQFHFFAPKNIWVNGKSNIHWHDIGPGIDDEVQKCKTVITGSGTSIWNFLASSKIVGALLVAENQASNYKFVSSHGVALPLGNVANPFLIDERCVELLLLDSETRRRLEGGEVPDLDLKGASRFADLIQSLAP